MSNLDIWGDPKEVNTHECPRCCETCRCANEDGCSHVCDEGEEIDPDAPSSETNSGIERDWAAGYGRGQ